MGAVILALGLWAPAARGQGLDQTCALTLTAFDPAVINVAYPDDSARYYVGTTTLPPGARVRITGRFPHARYMSFNVYDAALRPVEGISDVRLAPDPGSTNPFVEGADRTARDRSYTAFVESGTRPEGPGPRNTLYAPPGQTLILMYRIYIPDRGRDEYGDAGLPTTTVEPATGSAQPATSPCAEVEKPTVAGINERLAQQATPVDGSPTAGTSPPTWRKFVNVVSAVAINLTESPQVGPVNADQAGGSGGFLSNKDNAYVSTQLNRGFSRVSVTQLAAPTFPDTRGGVATMPGGQLRYWSVCQNDPPSQRFIACLNDDRSVVRNGLATYVVSPPGDRPANARAECGVNWLPYGANPRGILILRHMLPRADFPASVQGAKVDQEAATMGEAFPRSRYVTKADFEALGCAGDAAAQQVPATTTRCLSRRRVAITVPRGARTARVTVAGRTRTVRVRGRRAVVDLRGLPKGRRSVRIVVRTARGTTVLRRSYRTCTKRGA